MFQRRRPQYRGWFAPLFRLRDSIAQGWDNLRHFTGRVFNFRWLSRAISSWAQYLWWAVRYPFVMLSWLMGQLWSVLVAWWQIRNFRYLIQGLPALIGIIFIIIVTAYTYLRADDGLQEMYTRQAMEAHLHADSSKERLCYERLMQLQYAGDPRRQDTQFNLGVLAEALGQKQRSRSLLQELSNPDNDEGYPEAHLARARAIWQQSRRQKDDLLLIEKHLRRALKKQPDSPIVNGFLGQVLKIQGRTDEAIPLLLKSKPDDVDSRLDLATIYKMQGNLEQAKMYIDPLISTLKSRASSEIDDVRVRVTLARAYMQLDEFEDAIKTMEAGYALKKSDFYKTYLSNCYVNWYLSQLTKPITPERERLKLDCLVRSLEWDNTNVQAMNCFVTYMKDTGSDSNERKETHKMLLALRGNNAYLHLYLGDKLHSEGKEEEAAKEWDLAFKLNPDSAVIANNFAWILTQGSNSPYRLEPDLLKAERIITQVINRTSPEDKNLPNFHGTRGTVYMKMGRFEEARVELVAASQRPDATYDRILQKQLVDVYDHLKMPTMAASHRKLLTDLIRQNSRTEAATEVP